MVQLQEQVWFLGQFDHRFFFVFPPIVICIIHFQDLVNVAPDFLLPISTINNKADY